MPSKKGAVHPIKIRILPRRKCVVLRTGIHAPGRDALVPRAAQMLGVGVVVRQGDF
jgi:hypothetical protein